MTLREIVDQNPDWLDHDIVVESCGEYHFVGASGDVYLENEYRDGEEGENAQLTGKKLVVFVGN